MPFADRLDLGGCRREQPTLRGGDVVDESFDIKASLTLEMASSNNNADCGFLPI